MIEKKRQKKWSYDTGNICPSPSFVLESDSYLIMFYLNINIKMDSVDEPP